MPLVVAADTGSWLACSAQAAIVPRADRVIEFSEVYDAHLDFVVRTAARLGVARAALEDVAHDVFLVVHRRLPTFDAGRGGLRSWLYGITRRVVLHHHRAAHRRDRRLALVALSSHRVSDPEDDVAKVHAASLVERFLAELDEEKREVFVLADIEGLTAPEIATAMRCKLNTVYSRLRVARQKFEAFIEARSESALAEEGDGGGTP
jgi:RNA polymerase sigma-70 factor, ECF subfamily